MCLVHEMKRKFNGQAQVCVSGSPIGAFVWSSIKEGDSQFCIPHSCGLMDILYWTIYLASLLSCSKRRNKPQAPLQIGTRLQFSSASRSSKCLNADSSIISNTDYARHCRNIMELYKNLSFLGQVLHFLGSSKSLCLPQCTYSFRFASCHRHWGSIK